MPTLIVDAGWKTSSLRMVTLSPLVNSLTYTPHVPEDAWRSSARIFSSSVHNTCPRGTWVGGRTLGKGIRVAVADGVGLAAIATVAVGKSIPAALVAEAPADDPGPAMHPLRTAATSIPIAVRPACEAEAGRPAARVAPGLLGENDRLQGARLLEGGGRSVRILIERQPAGGLLSARLRDPFGCLAQAGWYRTFAGCSRAGLTLGLERAPD